MDMGMVLLMSWRIFDKSADLFATKPARGTCTLLLMVQSAMALQCHSCLQSIALKVKNHVDAIFYGPANKQIGLI